MQPPPLSTPTANTPPARPPAGRRRPSPLVRRRQTHCPLRRVWVFAVLPREIAMSFRSQQLYKKIAKKVGDSVPLEAMKSMKKCLPDSKLVMERAKRGIYAGRHIQFGNKVSEDGGNKSRRTWKPNVQEKRLFSYILDRHIRVKVTTHALRCIDKAGGIDEYLLKTPYDKMDTEMGLLWKAKIEKMYEDLGKMEVCFFSPEEAAKIEAGFKEYKTAKTETSRAARRNFTQSIMGFKLLGNENQHADKVTSQDQTEEKASNGS